MRRMSEHLQPQLWFSVATVLKQILFFSKFPDANFISHGLINQTKTTKTVAH